MSAPRKPHRTKGRSQKRSERRLTIRQRRLVKGVAAGKPILQAAKAAGYTETSAHSVPYRNGKVRQAIVDLMDRMGLDDVALLQAVKDALHARRNGKAVDHPIRLRAAETGLKLKGHLQGREEPEPPGSGPVVAIQFIVGSLKEAQEQAPRGDGEHGADIRNVEFRVVGAKRSGGQ